MRLDDITSVMKNKASGEYFTKPPTTIFIQGLYKESRPFIRDVNWPWAIIHCTLSCRPSHLVSFIDVTIPLINLPLSITIVTILSILTVCVDLHCSELCEAKKVAGCHKVATAQMEGSGVYFGWGAGGSQPQNEPSHFSPFLLLQLFFASASLNNGEGNPNFFSFFHKFHWA